MKMPGNYWPFMVISFRKGKGDFEYIDSCMGISVTVDHSKELVGRGFPHMPPFFFVTS